MNVDHYRPWKAVSKDNKDPVKRVTSHGVHEKHPGYYWLAYTWTNLLPSCVICNQTTNIDGETIGKGTRFPARKYAWKQGDEDKEEPLLLNPLLDEPEKHFSWDSDEGVLCGETAKGKMCIKIFGFHKREQLREECTRAYKEVITNLFQILAEDIPVSEKKEKVNELRNNIKEGKEDFSLVRLRALSDHGDITNDT